MQYVQYVGRTDWQHLHQSRIWR